MGNLEATTDEIITDIADVITSSARSILDLQQNREETH